MNEQNEVSINATKNDESMPATVVVFTNPTNYHNTIQLVKCEMCFALNGEQCRVLTNDSFEDVKIFTDEHKIKRYAYQYLHSERLAFYLYALAQIPRLAELTVNSSKVSEPQVTEVVELAKANYNKIVESTYCSWCEAELNEPCKDNNRAGSSFLHLKVHRNRELSYYLQQINESRSSNIGNDELTLNQYHIKAIDTAFYPNRLKFGGLIYTVMKLNGEAGELAEKIGKLMRDDNYLPRHNNVIMPDEVKAAIARELGDVLWYVAATASEIGYSFNSIATLNLEKLQSRKERNKLSGSGDNR